MSAKRKAPKAVRERTTRKTTARAAAPKKTTTRKTSARASTSTGRSAKSSKTTRTAGASTRSATKATTKRAPQRRTARAEDSAFAEEHELGIGSRVVPHDLEYAPASEPESSGRRRPGSEDVDVEAQIRELEARLDGLIRGASESASAASLREQVQDAAQKVVDRLTPPIERPGGKDGGVADAMRELASSDYYLRQWGRLGLRSRSEEVDDFGLDPTYEARFKPFLDFLHQRYFRTETEGVRNIPADGRCLVVCNHSGVLPLDGLMLRTALRLEHPSQRELRWLAEDFVFYLPFVGAFMNRMGAVRACQENAERLLKKNSLVAVFPEGLKGIGKLYRERYRLQRFGRGGFIRLALRTQTPIVPTAIIGAEEATPMLHRVEYLTKAFGLPYLPVTPTFPALGLAGLVPAPTKWRFEFGEPLHFEGYGPEAADDHVLVGRLAERVRATIQRMVDEGLARRQSVWLG